MASKLTSKCQVTIPKAVREALGVGPGSRVEFDVDEHSRIILRRAEGPAPAQGEGADRFRRVRGRATVKWRTDDLMALLRGDD